MDPKKNFFLPGQNLVRKVEVAFLYVHIYWISIFHDPPYNQMGEMNAEPMKIK